jgi:hypothetical protein
MFLRPVLLLVVLLPIARAQDPASGPAPKHHLTLRFEATQASYRRLSTPLVFTFDSATATRTLKDEYLAGHDPAVASGHCWYGEMDGPFPSPRTLRVLWWEITYANGHEWIAGAILNESTPPVGRVQGRAQSRLDRGRWNGFYPSRSDEFFDDVEIPDHMGAEFHWGAPEPWIQLDKIQYYARVSAPPIASALDFSPIAAPDFAGGWSWNPQWDPLDRTHFQTAAGVNPYLGDHRNPNILAIVGDLPLRRVYERQTHSHYLTQQMSAHLTSFLNAQKRNDRSRQLAILLSLSQFSGAQTGTFSPTLGPPHWISGRPQYLAISATGDQPKAGVRYNLTKTDRAALKPFLLHEGREEIAKGRWQFTECFGRDQLDPDDPGMNELQARASQYGGQYGAANGYQEFEHGGWVANDAAAWVLYADPLALRRLHHAAEGHCSVPLQAHSSRSTCGWELNDCEEIAYLFSGTAWNDDAARYQAKAREAAVFTWQHKVSSTPYKCLLTRGYEYLPRPGTQDPSYKGVLEGAFQLAIATLAFARGAELEPPGEYRNLSLDLVRYCAECAMQPGIVDWERGIIDSYPALGPDASAPNAARGLEMRASPHQGRDWISDQGWLGPAMAAAAKVTGDAKIMEFARRIWLMQKARKVDRGMSFLSPDLWYVWGMHYRQAEVFGW